MRRDFDSLAPWYDRGLGLVLRPAGGEARLRRKIASFLSRAGLAEESRILEIGAGTGSNLKALEGARGTRFELVGLDLSLPMIGQARRKTYLSRTFFIRGDAAALPFPDAAFDAALAIFTLHELPGEEREKAAAEMSRVLKSGGAALVADLSCPAGGGGKLLFAGLRIIESAEALSFARRGPDGLFLGRSFTKMAEERLFLGLVALSLYRR